MCLDVCRKPCAPYGAASVADPEQVLSECARVLRPGGEIILVNHFYSGRGAVAAIERRPPRYVGVIGLRPDFPLSRLRQWADGSGGIEFAGSEPVELPRIFTVVRFRRPVAVRRRIVSGGRVCVMSAPAVSHGCSVRVLEFSQQLKGIRRTGDCIRCLSSTLRPALPVSVSGCRLRPME